MVRLTAEQRAALGETVRDFANLAAGALILGQFVGQLAVSGWLMLVGVLLWVVLVSTAVWLVGEQPW